MSGGSGGICLSAHLSISSSCRSLFSSCRRKGEPLSSTEKAAMALLGSCPARYFAKNREREGKRTPTNKFYKLDAPTAPSLKALLGREVGEEEVPGQRNRSGEPTSLQVHLPSPPRSSRGKALCRHRPPQRGKGRERGGKEMAFSPSGTVFCCCSSLLHLNTGNYLIKLFLMCSLLYLLLCINR